MRSICSAWERGDFSSAEWANPEVEWVIVGGPEPDSWTGLARMAQGGRAILDAWQDVRAEMHGYRELDGERILAFLRMIARGKASGLQLGEVQSKGANLFQLRDGKVTRLVFYWDRERALAYLGLASEGDAPS